MGNRAERGERETERERIREGERQRWCREKKVWVIREDGFG